MSVATTEPLSFIAGDTVVWQKTFGDYPASAGWALSYALVKDSALILIDGSKVVASGDDFVVTIPAADSVAYASGDYAWQSYVTKSGERYQVGHGIVEIKPDFATQSTGYDARTIIKQTLDALEAMLLKKASKDQMSLHVPNGRRVDRLPPEQLLMWRDKLKAEYEAEVQAERISQGLGSGRKIFTRFT